MSTVRNWVSNPSVEGGTLSGFWLAKGRYTVEQGGAARCPGASGQNVILWEQDGLEYKPENWVALTVPNETPVTPGQWVRVGARAWGTSRMSFRAGFSFLDADRKAVGYWLAGPTVLHPDGRDSSYLMQVPEGAAVARARTEIRPNELLRATDNEQVRFDNFYVYAGDTPEELPTYFFDGSTPTAGGYSYGWASNPHVSTSYRIDTIDLVHPWTRSWWDTLPNAYKEADAHQNPELGGFPLLRWMNGIGQLGGEMRQISDDLWAGRYTNPATVPDSALRWLAMMLGLSAQHREQTNDVLRERLTTLTNVGRSAAGTRAMIAESAKAYLLPGAQARVEPSSKRPHVLIMYVRAYEVPNDDLTGLAAKVNAAGFVPAGHIVECKPVVTTWDAWEATAGETWADKERNIKTWNESDSAGVVLE